MLFWKDVGNGILLDCPPPIQIAPELPTVTRCVREINPAAKSGRDSRGNADLDCCDADSRSVGALHWAAAFSFNCSVL